MNKLGQSEGATNSGRIPPTHQHILVEWPQVRREQLGIKLVGLSCELEVVCAHLLHENQEPLRLGFCMLILRLLKLRAVGSRRACALASVGMLCMTCVWMQVRVHAHARVRVRVRVWTSMSVRIQVFESVIAGENVCGRFAQWKRASRRGNLRHRMVASAQAIIPQ